MARGDKNYDKVVRTQNKGGKSKARIKAVHNMVENIIQGDMDAAAEDLKLATQLISREILLGEESNPDHTDGDEDDVTSVSDDLESEMDNDDDDDDDDADDDDVSDNSKKATEEDADKKKKRHEDMDAVD